MTNNHPHDPRVEHLIREQLAQSIQRPQQTRVQLPAWIPEMRERIEVIEDVVGAILDALDLVLPREAREEMDAKIEAVREDRRIARLPRVPIVLWSFDRLVPEVAASVDHVRAGEDPGVILRLVVAEGSPLQENLDRAVFRDSDLGTAMKAASGAVLAEKWRAHQDGKYTDEQLTRQPGDPELPPQLTEAAQRAMTQSSADYRPRGKLEVVKS